MNVIAFAERSLKDRNHRNHKNLDRLLHHVMQSHALLQTIKVADIVESATRNDGELIIVERTKVSESMGALEDWFVAFMRFNKPNRIDVHERKTRVLREHSRWNG
jgi:hypothetical protein